MKRNLFAAILAVLGICSGAMANDGVYFTSGSFLVPVKETDISVTKEVLTITIGKDSFARVDVYYELMNNGAPKTVTMGFEAAAPYNSGGRPNKNGQHPDIEDFTVTMNGARLKNKNAVVAMRYIDGTRTVDFTPLDMNKWVSQEDVTDTVTVYDDQLYNAELDSAVAYAYAYNFKAPFKEGANVVHHTYRYRMSYSIGQRFQIPYWLTPVTRWANGQADDFTLKITVDKLTEFCLGDSMFLASPFKGKPGSNIYQLTTEYGEPMLFATVCDGDTVTWHGRNFRPASDMYICSPAWDTDNPYYMYKTADKVVIDKEGNVSRYLADCGDSYFVSVQDYALVKKKTSRVKEYRADKGQGYVVVNSSQVKKSVNVRQRPDTRSRKIATIAYDEGMVPETYRCLGFVSGDDKEDSWSWYKIKIGNKIGYVRQDLMYWDSIDSY